MIYIFCHLSSSQSKDKKEQAEEKEGAQFRARLIAKLSGSPEKSSGRFLFGQKRICHYALVLALVVGIITFYRKSLTMVKMNLGRILLPPLI